MNNNLKFGPLLVMALLMTTTGTAQAGKLFADLQILGRLGHGSYDWKDSDSLGNEIGNETGSWTSLNLTANNFFRKTSGVIYGVELEYTGGNGDYYGDAWSGVIVLPTDVATTNARTSNSSLNVGIFGGYRVVLGPIGFNALAGIGNYHWSRTIKNGRSTTNTLTLGHDEQIDFLGFRLAGGIDLTLGRLRIEFTGGTMLADGTRTLTLDIPTSDDSVDGDAKTKYLVFAGVSSGIALDESGRHRVELNASTRRFETKAASQVYTSPSGTAYLMPGMEASTKLIHFGYSYTF